LAKYGDIPSSHGDIPKEFCPIDEIELKSKLNRILLKFLPALGALFWLLQVSKMYVFMTCTFFKFGFSLDAKPYPILGSSKFICEATTYHFQFVQFHQLFSGKYLKPISFKKSE